MIKKVSARLVIFLGLPLLVVSYVPYNNNHAMQTTSLPPSQEFIKFIVPSGKAFSEIKKLDENKKYMKAVEDLKNIPPNSPQYKEAKELTSQLQQKIIETLGACQYGFDPIALEHSSFYKASNGKYIAQVECYLSASQPAYEYYLYTETPTNMKVKPLNLTQFELDYRKVSKSDSNFITGIPEFNKKTQELVVLQKYGELGDCGTLGTYKFEKNEFILKQLLADFKCGDRKLYYEKLYPSVPAGWQHNLRE